MKEEKLQTLHPNGKGGVSMVKRRYDLVANTMLTILREAGGSTTFTDLIQKGKARLGALLDGNPSWYLTTVQLDLEARGILQRREGEGPQVVLLNKELVR